MRAPRGPGKMPGDRIVVVGTSGSGKTTTGRQLAALLGARHIELDALHWEPDWTPAPPEVFRARVADAVAGERWVVDGNYRQVRDLTWDRADTIVWLDYPLPRVLWQVTRRTVGRLARREVLWGTNRESFRQGFLSRDSIILWALTTYRERRRRYEALFASGEYADRVLVRLGSPGETRRWLRLVATRAGSERPASFLVE